MSSRRLGVAQLSFWFVHAEEFCHRALLTPGVDLIGAWDSDIDRGERRCRAHGIPFEPDLTRLLERPDLDAVSICAEPFRHPELVEAVAEAGKQILIEKPMASSVDGARRIVDAAKRHGVGVMPAYNLRYHPMSAILKATVDSGELGELVRVRRLHGHFLEFETAGFRAGEIAADWVNPVLERRDSLFFAGSHVALWYEWMFGMPTSVSCMRFNVVRDLPVEDNTTAMLNFDNRFIGVMEISETLIAQQSVTEIYGTDGVIVQRRGNLPSTRVRDEGRSPIMIFDRRRNEWRAPAVPSQFLRHEDGYSSAGVFLSSLLADKPFPDGPESGLRSIAILAAAELSSQQHREVGLDEVLV